jgi:hypothetical protein
LKFFPGILVWDLRRVLRFIHNRTIKR